MIKRQRSSTNRAHGVGVIVSAVLTVLGLLLVATGAFAWSQERPDPLRLRPSDPLVVTTSPLFEPGLTVFAQGEDLDPPEPSAWGCSLDTGGESKLLRVKPEFNSVGSRVLKGEPFVPVVTIGQTSDGDRVTCTPEAGLPTELAVMSTSVGVRPVPLALIVAGIAALGLAGLVHPRGRGIRRFGT